jgi:hypothetical protein
VEEFTDELSDEALDREQGSHCVACVATRACVSACAASHACVASR